jgi:viroplasmin and RNaseH domain-containing protein
VEEAVSKTETMEDKEIAEEEESQEDAAPITDTFDEFEDLFEDADTTYTSYRMIVAQEQDTYASIAKRYDVDEAALRSNNHDKEIHHKTLVILP